MTAFPSLGATGIGKIVGTICESIPSPFGLPKVSYLFALVAAPIALLLYLWQRAAGVKYVLTNRGVYVWTARTHRRLASAGLDEIADGEIDVRPGQEFYDCADIRLIGPDGQTVLRLRGVKEPRGFLNAILRTVEAHKLVQESASRIAARA